MMLLCKETYWTYGYYTEEERDQHKQSLLAQGYYFENESKLNDPLTPFQATYSKK